MENDAVRLSSTPERVGTFNFSWLTRLSVTDVPSTPERVGTVNKVFRNNDRTKIVAIEVAWNSPAETEKIYSKHLSNLNLEVKQVIFRTTK